MENPVDLARNLKTMYSTNTFLLEVDCAKTYKANMMV